MKSEDVKTREDFIQFLKELDKDFENFMKENEGKSEYKMGSEWQNLYVGHFLEAISAWLEDSGKHKQKTLTWNDFADIIISGKYYE
ncbi:MAG: hypothetical protein NTZ83_02905 [Candidatus Pacearchaeota archaeon]|nr:hypothetical protein [Candidatus Pacearchaeota archaeon]